MRVLDEILTEFIQGVSFEAARVAQLAGRQKVKYEDFQFAMRKNPMFLGKAAENKELREALDKQRKVFDEDEYAKDDLDAAAPAGPASKGPGRGRKRNAAGGAVGGGSAAGNGASSTAEAANGASVNGNGQANGVTSGGIDDEELGDADDEEIDELVAPSNRKA